MLEALLTQVMIRMEDASAIKRRMFHYFMPLRANIGGRLLDKQPVGVGDRLLYALGDLLVYAPLRNSLGMSRVGHTHTRQANRAGSGTFYRSLGINLKQLYGSTETSVFVCVQENGGVKADTVGPPVKGVEIKLTDAGEILIRSPGLFREYYKAPEATRKRRTTAGFTPGTPATSTRWSSENHRSREGCRQTIGRHTVRTEVHREQAEVFPDDQGSRGVRRPACDGHRVRQHRHGSRRKLGRSVTTCRMPATPIWRQSPRFLRWCAKPSAR